MRFKYKIGLIHQLRKITLIRKRSQEHFSTTAAPLTAIDVGIPHQSDSSQNSRRVKCDENQSEDGRLVTSQTGQI